MAQGREQFCIKCGYMIKSPSIHERARAAEARVTAAEAREREYADALDVFASYGCPICNGDCAGANPPVALCPMTAASRARAAIRKETT